MDFNNFIRGFFGFRQPRRDNCGDDDCSRSNGCHPPEDYHDGNMNPTVDIFFHDGDHFDMKPMDPFSIFQQMEDAFNNFFTFDSGKMLDFDPLPPEESLKNGENYRDFLLNPSERDLSKRFSGKNDHIGDSGFSQIEPFTQPRNFRDPLLNPDFRDSQNSMVPKHQQDSDIDGAVIGKQCPCILKEFPQQRSPSINWSFKKSVSIRTVKGADGTVEEHRTERDSSGNEVTTVRKAIGDKSYSVTVHKDKEGIMEKREDLVNLDEKDIDQFQEKWWNIKGNNHSSRKDLFQEPDSLIKDAPGDPFYSSIFKNLFKS